MTVTNPSLIRRLAGGAVAGLVLIVAGSGADAASPCFEVEGHYDEHAVSEGCASPVGLCIALTYSGGVRGDAFGTATSIIPTIDTGTPTAPGTGVLESLDEQRIESGDMVAIDGRAKGSADATRGLQVFVSDRQAMQRAEDFTSGSRLIGCASLHERLLGDESDDGVNCRVDPLDLPQVRGHHLAGR